MAALLGARVPENGKEVPGTGIVVPRVIFWLPNSLTCCCPLFVWFFLEPPEVELSLESIEALSENAESLSGLSIRFPESEDKSHSNFAGKFWGLGTVHVPGTNLEKLRKRMLR